MEIVPVLEAFDARIPAWASGDLFQRPCPLCGFDRPLAPFVTRPDALDVVSCPGCGFFFVSPCPGRDSLRAFYSRYGSAHRGLSYDEREARRALRAPLWRSTEDPRVAALLTTGGIAGLKLLDVGCSRGEFLASARALGGVPAGLEMDGEAVAFVENKLGIPVIAGDVEQVALAQEQFDAITCWDLIEHLRYPMDVLHKLVAALKPGGRIAFWTPNGGLIQTWGKDWIGFRVDLEHLQYFDSHSLCSLLRRVNTDVIYAQALGLPALTPAAWATPGTARGPGPVRAALQRYRLLARAFRGLRSVRRRIRPSPLERLERKYESYHLLVIARKRGDAS